MIGRKNRVENQVFLLEGICGAQILTSSISSFGEVLKSANVGGHGGGEDQSVLMGSITTIY